MSREFVTDSISVIRAENPSPMTLEGTNTWILQAALKKGQASGAVVVDPGPDLAEHVDRLVELGAIDLVLVTHRHGDHTHAVDTLHERTGAPVRAFLLEHCREAQPLHGGEVLHAGGLQIQVMHTPGHTSDSLSFVVTQISDDGAPRTFVLTGDTVLGRGTTMIDHPDGTLADYLATLDRLDALATGPGQAVGLPGHGQVVTDLALTVRELREHRLARVEEVRAALATVGSDPETLTDHIYPDVPWGARHAAVRSIEAQMAYLKPLDSSA
ncbi:MBL fold metallo-hydrolase [Kocuria sp.]|uniref:MBL fold metallo-hydrolase n=1 Tax=Kocuria sp. TaxID=1871328 RepID=UPI0026DFF237|nr:MBL fold metallo-hydrolase [Kocuria sp.]MDO5619326.1 MBL fold metallo-hydrolase [Kocuria sp.]